MSEPITPEQRADWRESAESWHGTDTRSERIIALLDALDAAEAERDEWEGMFKRCLESENRAQDALATAEADNARLRTVLAKVEALADEWLATGSLLATDGSRGLALRAALRSCACGTDATAMDPAEVVVHSAAGCRIERREGTS
ncbi:hypothetical protein [Nocardioides montaniterrae]